MFNFGWLTAVNTGFLSSPDLTIRCSNYHLSIVLDHGAQSKPLSQEQGSPQDCWGASAEVFSQDGAAGSWICIMLLY